MPRQLLLASLALACGCAGVTRTSPLAPRISPDSAAFEEFVGRYLGGGRRGPREESPAAALAAFDPASERRAASRAAGQLAELRAIDTTHLSVPQRIDWLLVNSWLERAVYDTVLHPLQRVPARYLTLGDLPWRVAGAQAPTPAEWARVHRDLELAPRVMAIGRRQLETPPPLWARLAASSADGYAGFLRGEFVQRVDSLAPDSLKAPLREAGAAARAALESFAAFLRDSLRSGPEGSWAAGGAYYDWVLREVNFLPYGADSMIALGRRLHEQTKRALDSLARELRPGSSWRALADEMRSRHPEPGHVIDAYRAASHRVQGFLIARDLVRFPPCEQLSFVPTPPQLRETYAWGGYGGLVERDSALVGRFFVTDVVPGMSAEQVREKLRTQNDGWISVIALHEGYPGHHLQTVYERRNPRRLRRAGNNTYYGEGWALYAEHWMAREGLFAGNPDARLAQLQMRLWRTARVIIDPSIHTGRMTYEQAVQFFVDEVGLERSAAEAEVNRFTTWPTQAPSYIVGWQELETLEAEVRSALGPRFSEKDWIEKVLEAGPLPPALLRRAVLYAYAIGG